MSCPICQTRRAKRFCPGLARHSGLTASRWAGTAERICAPCCGAEREMTIDCPSTCGYLIAARRYEARLRGQPRFGGQAEPSRKAGRGAAVGAGRKPPTELAFPEVRLDGDFLADRQGFIGQLVVTIVRTAEGQGKLTDPEILAALERLAQTYQTLTSGLYYEQPPESAWARELYAALESAIANYQQEHQQRADVSLRPADILKAAVFLVRLGRVHANGRPLSRAFLDFLRAQLPTEPSAKTQPRLIIPGT